MREQLLLLEQSVKAEEQKQKQLQTAIHNVESDPKTVERLARQKLGYANLASARRIFNARIAAQLPA